MGLISSKRSAKAVEIRGSAAHSTSAAQERKVSSRFGGKVVPRSGAGVKKGDIQVKGLARLEVKGTTHRSFSVTKGLLQKTDMAALSAGEYPVIVIQFMDAVGRVEDEQAVMRLSDLEDLIERIQTLQAKCP